MSYNYSLFIRKREASLGDKIMCSQLLFSCFRLQFYMKLEERHQAMEEEKIQLEARLKVTCPDAISEMQLNPPAINNGERIDRC